MPFILIAKAADGQLRLLTESSFATRGEALSELSRITADPSFDRWDDEVLAIDLDAGTPVLLVRPAEAAAPAVEDFEETVTEGDQAQEPLEGTEVEAEEADDEDDESVEEPTPSLKDALKRTTVQLEAEGIVAPESVGPAPVEAEAEEEDAAAEAQGDEPTATAAWPWATAQEDKTFELDPLEAPGNFEGSLVRAPGDDETMSFARPVIMGTYGEESVAEAEDSVPEVEAEPSPEPEPEPEPAVEPEPETAVEPAVEPETESVAPGIEVEFAPETPVADREAPIQSSETVASEPVTVSDSMGSADTSTEDAIDDLLADVTAAHAESQAASESSDFVDLPPTAVTPPIDTMTCDDCVYTDSCPNKGQMAPASCGSFQWK